ncbi:MAG: SPW repeat protein [Gammaproteobacteria bacterium]|nr:SPW repeat protein [Gammaproteobacteria bacterium]
MKQRRWQDGLILVLGIWLLISPFILGYADHMVAARNSYILGIGVAIFAIMALRDPRRWEEWVNLALGVWLIISPFVLRYSHNSTPTWNHVIVGLLIGADALMVIYGPNLQRKRITS